MKIILKICGTVLLLNIIQQWKWVNYNIIDKYREHNVEPKEQVPEDNM